jgi:hypothetical protein
MLEKQAWWRTWTSCCPLYLFTNLQYEEIAKEKERSHILAYTPNIKSRKGAIGHTVRKDAAFDFAKGRAYVIRMKFGYVKVKVFTLS